MLSVLLAILRFPPVLHVIRIGIASVAEALLLALLKTLPWENDHHFLLNIIAWAADALLIIYLLKLILDELLKLAKWIKNRWNDTDGESSDDDKILR
jgi:hypothetical protein